MTKNRTGLSRPTWALLALLALAGTASARPLSKAELNEAMARYRADVAVCMSGQSNQARVDCLHDADGALVVAKRGEPDNAEAIQSNRKARCEPLPEDQRKDCLARMDGAGVVKGSVADGGIYRELKTIEVGKVPEGPK